MHWSALAHLTVAVVLLSSSSSSSPIKQWSVANRLLAQVSAGQPVCALGQIARTVISSTANSSSKDDDAVRSQSVQHEQWHFGSKVVLLLLLLPCTNA